MQYVTGILTEGDETLQRMVTVRAFAGDVQEQVKFNGRERLQDRT